MGKNGFADEFFPRVVGWGAIAVAAVQAEIVARDADIDTSPRFIYPTHRLSSES